MVGCSITGNSFNPKNISIVSSLISVAAPISQRLSFKQGLGAL